MGICSKYLVHTPRARGAADASRGWLKEWGPGGEGRVRAPRYLRHIILHYVSKRRTNAVLIYASPRVDKRKRERRPAPRTGDSSLLFFAFFFHPVRPPPSFLSACRDSVRGESSRKRLHNGAHSNYFEHSAEGTSQRRSELDIRRVFP